MLRLRLLPAIAGLLLSCTAAPAAAPPAAEAGRAHLRRALYELREAGPSEAIAIPLHAALRGLAFTLDALATGESHEAEYWLRAAKNHVRLAHVVGASLSDLENRTSPEPAPIAIRADLRRVAVELRALAVHGSGDASYWRRVAARVAATVSEKVAVLRDLEARVLAGAADRVVPGTLSMFHFGRGLIASRPAGEGTWATWQRAAEDQVALARASGLGVAGHVRFLQGPVRGVLLREAAALRAVALRDPDDITSWLEEAMRLDALLRSHKAVLDLVADELN